jgi:FkbM family methyltransferase
MSVNLRKLLRTLQSELPYLKEAKDTYYYFAHKLLHRPHELEWYALRHIPDALQGCYVDAGANQGQSIESIKLFKPHARIYSFEANELLATKLQRRYRNHTEIIILPYGLGAETQTRTLFIPAYKGFVYDGEASLDKEAATGLLNEHSIYLFDRSRLEVRQLTCELQPLDNQHLDPIFIKIDVQGYEYDVLKGGVETIRQHEPILMVEGFHWNEHLAELAADLGYEEYVFDDSGFHRGTALRAVNTLLMTRRRAATVHLSRP